MSSIGNKEILAQNIRRYMDIAGIKAKDICDALSIPMPTFSDWINAKTYPRIDKIEMMANYFGSSKADLVEKNDDPDEEYTILARNAKKLSPEQRKQLLAIAKVMFKEEFKD